MLNAGPWHPGSSISLRSPRLGGEPDHLDARAPRDIHGLNHFLIHPVDRRLHEQQLGGPLVEDGVDLGIELILGHRLPVDVVAAVRRDFQHDLGGGPARLTGNRRGDLHVDRHAGEGLRDHEDDQQHQHDVDHRNDVWLGTDPVVRAARRHAHAYAPCVPGYGVCWSNRPLPVCFTSVIAAMTRTPERRAVSTASWILPYWRSLSARKYMILSSGRAA